MKRKRIQYVSLESGAFISDLIFQTMTAAERGVYCTLIFYLYENNGRLPFDIESLKHLCNCEDFEKVWEFVKQKFIIKNGRILHKRVLKELDRAKKLSQVQSEKGVKGMKSRWSKDNTAIAEKLPDNNQAKRSDGKPSEDKPRENTDTKSVSSISKDLLPAVQTRQQGSIASQINCLKSPLRPAGDVDPTNMMIFYDRLAGVFGGRTPSDSSALRNLVHWLKDCVAKGAFTSGIYQRVLDMAADSKNGNSRKPIAVFFAQVKRDLGYKKDA